MNSVTPITSAAINLRRLTTLRNIALACEAFTVSWAIMKLHIALPLRELVWVIGVFAGVNLLTWLRLRRPWPVRDAELFGQLLLDVSAFTWLMYFGGGPTNPFVTLYLVPLALTAVALPAGYTWAMAAVTAACYSALMFWYVPLPLDHSGHDSNAMQLHVIGMWAGFLLSDLLLAWFAVKMGATVRERDRLRAEMRERELKHERVLALGTLAAGAAHELGTPLSTMAVLVKDIKPQAPVPEERLRILRGEIDRCKEILSSLSAAAGNVRAESGQSLALDVFLERIIERWLTMRPAISARRHLEGVRPAPRIVAEQTLSQAILNILNNAADASPQDVSVEARWNENEMALEVADRGPGLTPDIAQSVGEPGISTKSDGMGLGLFLAYTTLQRFGGDVRLTDREGGGVVCRLTLPLAPILVPSKGT